MNSEIFENTSGPQHNPETSQLLLYVTSVGFKISSIKKFKISKVSCHYQILGTGSVLELEFGYLGAPIRKSNLKLCSYERNSTVGFVRML